MLQTCKNYLEQMFVLIIEHPFTFVNQKNNNRERVRNFGLAKRPGPWFCVRSAKIPKKRERTPGYARRLRI